MSGPSGSSLQPIFLRFILMLAFNIRHIPSGRYVRDNRITPERCVSTHSILSYFRHVTYPFLSCTPVFVALQTHFASKGHKDQPSHF